MAIHESGTARMGNDPKTFVTDPYCQLHDVKTRYVPRHDRAPQIQQAQSSCLPTTQELSAVLMRTSEKSLTLIGNVLFDKAFQIIDGMKR
jgi:GMC oxidoreductase